MNIIAASDLHGVVGLDELGVGAGDVCILAGDIAPLYSVDAVGKIEQEAWVDDILVPFVRDHSDTEFVIVPGNHDFWGESCYDLRNRLPQNAHLLVNSECVVDGVRFYGMPFVPPISGRWAFERGSMAMTAACDSIPSDIDVLVTHTPPYVPGANIDVSIAHYRDGSKIRHLGSDILADAVRRVRPRYLFCGHIHTGEHEPVVCGETKCFNVSLIDENYEKAYRPLRMKVFS